MASANEDFFNQLPKETQKILRNAWDTLPQKEQNDLQKLLKTLPTNTNLMKMLVDLSIRQVKLAFGQKNKVAIIGPANVGKSTLYNQFIRNRSDRAEVSPLPGTTRVNQVGDAGLFSIIDTPGADAVGEVGESEKMHALNAAAEADFLIIVFDAIQGIKKTEQELYKEIITLGKPYIIVMNKSDLVRREIGKIIERAAGALGFSPNQIIAISARDGQNLDKVMLGIAASEPEIVAALGQALPPYRFKLAWRSILSAASMSAVIALAPLPLVDFIPLVLTQSAMVIAIARIYNFKITFVRAKELVITFGIGFMARTLFQELSKLGGLPGWMLSAAIAASTTIAMGYAATVWFEKGEKVTSGSLKKISQSMTAYLLENLKGLGKHRPTRDEFQKKIEIVLENTTLENIVSTDNTPLQGEEPTL